MAKNKRRSRRKSGFRRMLGTLCALMLLAAVFALGIWIVVDRFDTPTVTTYIVEYEDLIRKYAAENDLQPAYVASVIMAESSYRADAVSGVNAQGLMQILPDTGVWIAGKFNETYVEGCLFDPETSIRYGCWYLGWLMDRYNDDMSCASSAYHAGQGTVDQWLQNPEYSLDGKTLSKIPSDATGTYVERILKYYEKYEEVYA